MKTRKGGYINVKRPPRLNDYVVHPEGLCRVISIKNKEIELEMGPDEKNIWVDPETVYLYDRSDPKGRGMLPESDKYYHNKQELPKSTSVIFNLSNSKEENGNSNNSNTNNTTVDDEKIYEISSDSEFEINKARNAKTTKFPDLPEDGGGKRSKKQPKKRSNKRKSKSLKNVFAFPSKFFGKLTKK